MPIARLRATGNFNVYRRPTGCVLGLGRLAVWHLPSGPVGPASRWAAASNVEVGQTTYSLRLGGKCRDGGERKERRTKSQRGGEERREWNGEGARDL